MVLVKLEARLARVEERVRWLEQHPTLPGGDWDYREALREWVAIDARLEALKRELEWTK